MKAPLRAWGVEEVGEVRQKKENAPEEGCGHCVGNHPSQQLSVLKTAVDAILCKRNHVFLYLLFSFNNMAQIAFCANSRYGIIFSGCEYSIVYWSLNNHP